MPVNNQELLIDHLDKKMQGESIPEAEALLQADANAREQWQYLQAAVDAVEHHALHAKVAAIRSEMTGSSKKAPVRSITRNIYRVAAAMLVLFVSLAVYKFATVNANDFYSRHYIVYELPTSRSGAEMPGIELAYRNADWNAVNSVYGSLATKSNQDHFLAGIAAMQLKEFPAAIQRFTQILDNNAANNDSYFQDEAEYYLVLAYIANKEIAKASTLLHKIKADNNHLYREKAENMSGTDLKILELK